MRAAAGGYPARMDPIDAPPARRGFARVFAWRRVRTALVAVGAVFLLLSPGWEGDRFGELLPRLLMTSSANSIGVMALRAGCCNAPAWRSWARRRCGSPTC